MGMRAGGYRKQETQESAYCFDFSPPPAGCLDMAILRKLVMHIVAPP